MAETEHTQDNIAYIRTHLDKVDRMVRLQLRSNPNVRAEVEQIFRSKPGAIDAYLALKEKPQTQAQLVTKLSVSQPTVSRLLTHLEEAGLISRIDLGKKETLYSVSDIDSILGVSRIAGNIARENQKKAPRNGSSRPQAVRINGDGTADASGDGAQPNAG